MGRKTWAKFVLAKWFLKIKKGFRNIIIYLRFNPDTEAEV